MKTHTFMSALLSATLLSSPVLAQEDHTHHSHHSHHSHHGAGHVHTVTAPIGIMGDHTHEKGRFMLSYRYMRMAMDGNRNGTRDLSPLQISGDFANTSGSGPATLRIVPTKMDMDMHMIGAMYGVTDWATIMLMGNYLDKDMDLITYAMMNPDLEVGRFSTGSKGWGDTKLAGIFKLLEEEGGHSLTGKLGLSLPTGSITERGNILNPMGAQANIRLPYAMQLGSGTYDLEPALTYTGHKESWSWGAQAKAVWRLGDNDEGYSLGNKHSADIWGRYGWSENIGTSLRLSAEHEGEIDGRDSQIAGPVQTAQTENYGGKHVGLGIGIDLTGTQGVLKGHTVAAEANLPLYQNLNGPQMKRDYAFTLGYKFSF